MFLCDSETTADMQILRAVKVTFIEIHKWSNKTVRLKVLGWNNIYLIKMACLFFIFPQFLHDSKFPDILHFVINDIQVVTCTLT